MGKNQHHTLSLSLLQNERTLYCCSTILKQCQKIIWGLLLLRIFMKCTPINLPPSNNTSQPIKCPRKVDMEVIFDTSLNMIFHDLVYQGTTIILPKELAYNFSSSWWILFMKIKSVLYCLKWWGKPSFYCCLSLRFCQVYSIIRGNLTHASFSSFSLEYLAPVVIRWITGLKRNEYIFCRVRSPSSKPCPLAWCNLSFVTYSFFRH